MTSKEALELIEDNLESYADFCLEEDIIKQNKAFQIIKKNLEVLEKLKHNYIEEETDEYYRRSHWYWNEYLGELNCDTIIYCWDGTYKCFTPNYKGAKPIQVKNWVEVYHSGTASDEITIAQYLELKEKVIDKVVEENGK